MSDDFSPAMIVSRIDNVLAQARDYTDRQVTALNASFEKQINGVLEVLGKHSESMASSSRDIHATANLVAGLVSDVAHVKDDTSLRVEEVSKELTRIERDGSGLSGRLDVIDHRIDQLEIQMQVLKTAVEERQSAAEEMKRQNKWWITTIIAVTSLGWGVVAAILAHYL